MQRRHLGVCARNVQISETEVVYRRRPSSHALSRNETGEPHVAIDSFLCAYVCCWTVRVGVLGGRDSVMKTGRREAIGVRSR